MGDNSAQIVDVIGLQCLCTGRHKLGMLKGIWEEEGILGQPLEALDYEPVLSPQNDEVATPQIVQVRLEVPTVTGDRALRRFYEAVE
jgi:hypothetical protein